MRKWVFLLILSLMLTNLAQAETVKVWLVWIQEIVNVFQSVTEKDFTAKTGIKVEFTTMPGDSYEQKYLLAAASGSVPDIGIMGSLGPADLGVRGAMLELREAFGKEADIVAQNCFPGLLRSLEFRSALFGYPIQFNIYPMYYRQDIINEMGLKVPDTWDELKQILPKLQSKGRNFAFAFGLAGAPYADLSMFLWQNGADWYTLDRKKSGLDTPEALRGLKEFVSFFKKQNVPKDAQRNMGFKSGELPLMTGSSFDYPTFLTTMPELKGKWSVALAPGTKMADGTVNHAAYIGGNTLGIFKDSKNKKATWEFVKWFLSPEVQKQIASEISQKLPQFIFFSAVEDALKNTPMDSSAREVFLRQAKVSVAPPYALSPETVTHRYLDFLVYQTVAEGIDSEKALKQAASEMNNELGRKEKEFARFLQQFEVKK